MQSHWAQQTFEQGSAAHREGDFETAKRCYEAVLQNAPGHLAATQMLGAVHLQMGDASQAEAVLARALALDPTIPEVHNNLGLALTRLGRHGEAIAAYDTALRLRPGYAAALGNKGNALRAAGRPREAVACYDMAIAAAPDASALYNRGAAFEELKEFDAAISSYKAALSRSENFPEAWNNLGNALRANGKPEEALEAYARALAIKPDYAEAYANRGAIHSDQRRFDPALADVDKAIALAPGLANAFTNRANIHRELGAIECALEDYDKALALSPNDVAARWNKAATLLLNGEWQRGWPDYGLRLAGLPDAASIAGREWAGEKLEGKSILLYSEQGLGDAIQFFRFAQTLTTQGADVTLLVPAPLKKLLSAMAGLKVISELPASLGVDFRSPLAMVPRFLDLTPETIPPVAPYLSADAALMAKWRARLGREGFKVGICWQGSTGSIDSGRSIPLAQFAPLAAVRGVRLISLQRGFGLEQISPLPADMRVEAFADMDAGPDAFLDSAAIIANLDLVITSDTAIAHLAGALSRPVWVALKYVPDWRWLRQREDSPWYPSMRLFRQQKLDDWKGVFARIAAALTSR